MDGSGIPEHVICGFWQGFRYYPLRCISVAAYGRDFLKGTDLIGNS